MGKGVELQTETIIVALAIDDAALADRVAALLADVQGFHTAKFHVGRILDKLDATGRTNAVAHAARLGVIHL